MVADKDILRTDSGFCERKGPGLGEPTETIRKQKGQKGRELEAVGERGTVVVGNLVCGDNRGQNRLRTVGVVVESEEWTIRDPVVYQQSG